MRSVYEQKNRRTPQSSFERLDLERMLAWGRDVVPAKVPIVLPFSGGLDSATIAAFLNRFHGSENIVAVHVAHSTTQPQETENAFAVAQSLGIRFRMLNLNELNERFKASVEEMVHQVGNGGESLETTANASVVYTVCREIARRIAGRLCGTLDASEIITGYFPKECFYGDFAPLGGLFRGEVRVLARELGLPELPEQFAVVPGCGSIVEYVNSQSGEYFSSENELDTALMQALSTQGCRPTLVGFLERVSHKAKNAIEGRPVFFPSRIRERLLAQRQKPPYLSVPSEIIPARDLMSIDC